MRDRPVETPRTPPPKAEITATSLGEVAGRDRVN
jgi:hypothetical protein